MGFAALYPSCNFRRCGGRCRSLFLVPYALLAFVKALRDRRSSWYQRGLIREPLRKISVILLHDVEHGFPGERAMVLGKEPVHVYELFVGHGRRAWP
jgi:hypothetical protein